MPHELLHTSALRGLHLGTDGYCTVGETEGIPKTLSEKLEQLSSYRHRVKRKSPDPINNPIAFSHRLAAVGGQRYHIVSRIADAGFDHTNRTNYLAHHIALAESELVEGGPALLCQQSGLFQTEWGEDRKPQKLPARRLPRGDAPARKCKLWERLAGDAGWAGVLAGTYAGRNPVTIVYEPGQEVIDLLAEALAIVPANQRWRVSFSTYFTPSSGSDCLWRFVPTGSPEAQEAIEKPRGVVLRLDEPMSGQPAGELVAAARSGVVAASVVDIVEEDRPARARTAAPRKRHSVPDEKPLAVAFEEDEPRRPKLRKVVEEEEEVRVPRVAVPPPSESSPLKPMALGLALGLCLGVIGLLFVELTAKHSLTQLAEIESRPEKTLKGEKEKLEGDKTKLEGDKKKLEGDKRTLDEEIVVLKQTNVNLTSENTLLKIPTKSFFLPDSILYRWIYGLAKSTGDGSANLAAEEEKLKKDRVEFAKEKQRFDAERGVALQTISLAGSRSVKVLEPKTKASISMPKAPFGAKSNPDGAALTITAGTGDKAYSGTIKYDEKTGTLSLTDDGNPKTRPPLWSQSVVAVEVGEKNTPGHKTNFYQIGAPERFKFDHSFKKAEKTKTWDAPANLKAAVGEWTFRGSAIIVIDYLDGAGKNQLIETVVIPTPQVDGVAGALSNDAGPAGAPTATLAIVDGILTLGLQGWESDTSAKVTVKFAELVAATPIPGLPAPVIVARIQQ